LKLYAVRHGQTAMNRKQILQGQTNSSLDATGVAEAKALNRKIQEANLHFDAVYSSPLLRAKQTCQIITGLPDTEIQFDDRLMEIALGKWEGVHFTDLSPQELEYFTRHPASYKPPEGAESYEHLIARTKDFLSDVAASEEEGILVVSHGGVLHAMLLLAEDLPLDDFWKERIGNCSMLTFVLEGNNIRLVGKQLQYDVLYAGTDMDKEITDER
jgi:broad specificity phosphatase PhoE